MKQHPVTVVVLSKYKAVLDGFIESFKQQKMEQHAVVLVADGQADFEAESTYFERYKVVVGPEKFSMAGNANIGLRAVPDGHDVLYCGDDIRFLNPNTIETLQKIAYFNNQIGILSPKLLGRSSPALANPNEASSFSYVKPVEMWFPCVYIKAEVLDKVGLLDENFNEFGGDDLDYCIRVQKAGYKLAVTPKVVVQHEASPEGGPTTFVKNLGVKEWQKQQQRAWPKLMEKYKVDAKTFDMFLRTNDMRLLDPSALPEALPKVEASGVPVPQTVTPHSLADTTVEGQGRRGLQNKSLFVMVPMYGGQCTMNFVISFLQLIELCRQFGVPMSYMFLHNESLVTRARNRLFDYWDKKTNDTHGVFIDADIGFDPNDVLVALDLDLDIAGFPCVKKSIRWDRVQDLVKKFNSNGHAGKQFTSEELSKVSGDFILNFAEFTGRKTFNLGEPQLAHSVGTGLMIIARRVMEGLKEYYPNNWYIGSRTDAAALEGKIFDHFQVGVNPESQDYDSEDYRFCINARKAGFKVWVLPWTKTTHAGTHIFVGDLPTMSSLMPEWAR